MGKALGSTTCLQPSIGDWSKTISNDCGQYFVSFHAEVSSQMGTWKEARVECTNDGGAAADVPL